MEKEKYLIPMLKIFAQVVLEQAGSSCGVRSTCVYGGVPKWQQVADLKAGVEVSCEYWPLIG